MGPKGLSIADYPAEVIAPRFPEFAYRQLPAQDAQSVIEGVIDEANAFYSCCSLLPVVGWGCPGNLGDSGRQDHKRTADSSRAIRDLKLGTGRAGSAWDCNTNPRKNHNCRIQFSRRVFGTTGTRNLSRDRDLAGWSLQQAEPAFDRYRQGR
jgi:hypothetical protein